jgi:hypothetical protein
VSPRSTRRWMAAAFREMLRWVGLDANPMRRDLDHLETGVTVLLAVTFVVAGPVIASVIGESVVHAGMSMLALGIGVLTQVTLGLLLWDVRRKIRHVLDRRRLARWERAWKLIEPRWSGRT